jgi:hypothetical protein
MRRLAKLNATIGWRNSGALPMWPRSSNVTLTSSLSPAHRRRPVGVERLEQRERGAAGFSRP